MPTIALLVTSPRRGAQYCAFVCLSASITQKLRGHTLPIFCACFLWSRLRPPVAAILYVMYFRFHEWRHIFTQWPYGASCVFVSCYRNQQTQ